MHFSFVLLLLSPLVQALPAPSCPFPACSGPPPLGYPPGQTAATCPQEPGSNNPYSNFGQKLKRTAFPEAPSPRGLDAVASAHLESRDIHSICTTIAINTGISNLHTSVANTGVTLLNAGVGYLFSYAFDTYVEYIRIWGVDTASGSQYQVINQVSFDNHQQYSGTMAFTIPNGNNLLTHFEIGFYPANTLWDNGDAYDISGSIGLFQWDPR